MPIEDHTPNITVIMPYHNNIHDFLIALSKTASVQMITPRSFKKKTHLTPPIPTQKIYSTPKIGPITHAYNPFKLSRLLPQKTTHILIKHLDILENIIPILIAEIKGIKIIVMVQQINTSPLRLFIVKIISAYLKHIDAKIFSVTRQGHTALKKNLPNIEYIPACINLDRFNVSKLHQEKPTELRIITIGKYIKRKNFINLVTAVEEIKAKYPRVPIHLTLVGPIGDQLIYKKIQEKISKSKKLSQIITTHTDITPDKIPGILAENNLFILPAIKEPLGYAILEAMATGLPVIATNQVGSASYIEENKNGFIIPNGHAKTLIKKIMLFINEDQTINTEKIIRLGKNSRNLVKKLYTPDAIAEKIKKITL